MRVSGRSQTAGYDNLNRVASASGAYGSESYTYDGVGNRLTRVVGGTTKTYGYLTPPQNPGHDDHHPQQHARLHLSAHWAGVVGYARRFAHLYLHRQQQWPQ